MPPAETTEDIARVGLWGWRFVNFDIAATACERGNLWFRENSFTVGILLISVAHVSIHYDGNVVNLFRLSVIHGLVIALVLWLAKKKRLIQVDRKHVLAEAMTHHESCNEQEREFQK